MHWLVIPVRFMNALRPLMSVVLHFYCSSTHNCSMILFISIRLIFADEFFTMVADDELETVNDKRRR